MRTAIVRLLAETLAPEAAGKTDLEEVRTWVAWLASGLDPELRPLKLKRAFLYTIPE